MTDAETVLHWGTCTNDVQSPASLLRNESRAATVRWKPLPAGISSQLAHQPNPSSQFPWTTSWSPSRQNSGWLISHKGGTFEDSRKGSPWSMCAVVLRPTALIRPRGYVTAKTDFNTTGSKGRILKHVGLAWWRGCHVTGTSISSSSYCYTVSTWNIWSLNQPGKMHNVAQKMAQMNTDILGIAETFCDGDYWTMRPTTDKELIT